MKGLLLSFDTASGLLPEQDINVERERMMKLVPLALLTLFVTFSVQSIAAVDVPPPPTGFT
jgi:hypothetical protein